MATIFTYDNRGGLYTKGLRYASPMTSDILPVGDRSLGNFLVVITEVSISNSESVQYFTTFDDLINCYYFGKGVGNASIVGIIFLSCGGDPAKGVNYILSAVEEKRGKLVTLSLGNYAFQGILTDFVFSVTAEPETMVQFNLSFGIIEHNLKRPQIQSSRC